MLTLEIEFLTGVYRASYGGAAEWPPHPERAFSALVQAWGDGGCDLGERAALEWFEALEPPAIEADPIEGRWERDSPTVFVPPNDLRGDKPAVIPDRRPRQARSFRATSPASSMAKLMWPQAEATDDHKVALEGLAKRVASLGHSASLVRFAFTGAAPSDAARLWQPSDIGGIALRVPHQGRLALLEQWLSQSTRPGAGKAVHYRPAGPQRETDIPKSVFGGSDDWFVFEDAGGFRPDILAFAHVAKCVRTTLMKLGPQPTPEIIGGHSEQGGPTERPHIAIVPLANFGWTHATGDLLGFAVLLPRDLEPELRTSALTALARFARLGEGEEATAEVPLSKDRVWHVQRAASPSRTSLKAERWCGTASVWSSATPVLLDRFPEHGDVLEEAGLIAAACRNIGLPEPIEMEIHKHSAVQGAPSAYPARGARNRPDWSYPEGSKFARRPRRHVVVRFAQAIRGPVILGAGRFHGLGLFLPADRTS